MSSEELHITGFPALRSVGYVQRLVAYQGQVQIYLDYDLLNLDKFPSYVWMLQYGKPVPFKVVDHQAHTANEQRLFLEDITDEESAKRYKNLSVLVEIEQFSKYFEDTVSYDYLIDYRVSDKTQGPLGEVIDVLINDNGHDNLVVNYRDQEVIIPFVEAIILSINEEAHTIDVDLPEGLLDLYLN